MRRKLRLFAIIKSIFRFLSTDYYVSTEHMFIIFFHHSLLLQAVFPYALRDHQHHLLAVLLQLVFLQFGDCLRQRQQPEHARAHLFHSQCADIEDYADKILTFCLHFIQTENIFNTISHEI